MFTVAETGRILRMSRSKVDGLLKSKVLGHYKMGGRCFVTQADIDAYLASCRVEPQKKTPLPVMPAPHRLQRLSLD